WGRWRELVAQGRLKRRLSERDVESLCRAILLFCLLHFRGDDAVRAFAWALVAPPENGRARPPHGQPGVAVPGGRGRKGKKPKPPLPPLEPPQAEWLRRHNPEGLLQDEGYRKHLRHQCSKVLLRVRMLHFLHHEVIGDEAPKILSGAPASDIHLWLPLVEPLEVPTAWWDPEADKSLLIGVFKHGYERYHTMRADPALCFLAKAGGPDATAVAAEQRLEGPDGPDFDKDPEDPEYKPAAGGAEESDPLAGLDEEISVVDGEEGPPPASSCSEAPPPGPQAPPLTARFRRLIGALQRAGAGGRARAGGGPRRRQRRSRDKQQRWSRREQSDFLRVASTFGVELDAASGRFRWGRFRALANLERRSDQELTRFYHGFVAMCRHVCQLPPDTTPAPPGSFPAPFPVPPALALRCLRRLSLLRCLRERVLPHPALGSLLARVPPPAPPLPPWWVRGVHDAELLRLAARHGLGAGPSPGGCAGGPAATTPGTGRRRRRRR
ncbi:chromodomain-helicase-DNA-binding protein 8-like, partial [Myiozetetes cayanensis]|uniref:chromodomain-helicase-DNA-binding protein 8-like n=1 Tax=Myiozetetes cayanensis TaxID=478635 RepID=UPI00215F4D09